MRSINLVTLLVLRLAGAKKAPSQHRVRPRWQGGHCRFVNDGRLIVATCRWSGQLPVDGQHIRRLAIGALSLPALASDRERPTNTGDRAVYLRPGPAAERGRVAPRPGKH